MAKSLWDSLNGMEQGALSKYDNVVDLFKRLPHEESGPLADAGNQLRTAMTVPPLGLPNKDFLTKLDKALADEGLRKQIGDLAQKDPQALKAAMNGRNGMIMMVHEGKEIDGVIASASSSKTAGPAAAKTGAAQTEKPGFAAGTLVAGAGVPGAAVVSDAVEKPASTTTGTAAETAVAATAAEEKFDAAAMVRNSAVIGGGQGIFGDFMGSELGQQIQALIQKLLEALKPMLENLGAQFKVDTKGPDGPFAALQKHAGVKEPQNEYTDPQVAAKAEAAGPSADAANTANTNPVPTDLDLSKAAIIPVTFGKTV